MFTIQRAIHTIRIDSSNPYHQDRQFKMHFLAHLSTTWGGRVVQCLSSVMHHTLCVLRCASYTISLNIFSPQTAGPIWTKLGQNVSLEVFFKNHSQNLIPSKTLVARAKKWIFFLAIFLKIFC